MSHSYHLKESILILKKFKETVKDSEPLTLCAFFEQTRQSFKFFLKLGTCTYFKSFNKNLEPGLFECESKTQTKML
jgi:hypothetical protein